jgi:hypothetical protein
MADQVQSLHPLRVILRATSTPRRPQILGLVSSALYGPNRMTFKCPYNIASNSHERVGATGKDHSRDG